MSEPTEIPAMFLNVSPEDIGRLAAASLASDVDLNDPDALIGGVSMSSLAAFASTRVAETFAEVMSLAEGGELNDDTSVEEILGLVATTALTSFIEGFSLGARMNQLNQEDPSNGRD